MSFFTANVPLCGQVALCEVWWASVNAVRIRGQDVHEALCQHFVGPVFRPATKTAQQGPRCHLDPDATLGQIQDLIVVVFDPGQAFRVCQNGHVTRHQNVEEQLIHARWRDVVRWLDEHIAAVAERQEMAAAEAVDEIGDDVIVGAGDELQAHTSLTQVVLQVGNG